MYVAKVKAPAGSRWLLDENDLRRRLTLHCPKGNVEAGWISQAELMLFLRVEREDEARAITMKLLPKQAGELSIELRQFEVEVESGALSGGDIT